MLNAAVATAGRLLVVVLLAVYQPGRQLRLLDVGRVHLRLARRAGVVDLQVLECSGTRVVKVRRVDLDDAPGFSITSGSGGKNTKLTSSWTVLQCICTKSSQVWHTFWIQLFEKRLEFGRNN